MFNMSGWFRSSVTPATNNDDPIHMTSRALSDGILVEMKKTVKDPAIWKRYTEILFDRAIKPYNPILSNNHSHGDTPEHLLRHAIEASRDVESTESPIEEYVEKLARDLMHDNRTEAGYAAINNAFNLLKLPTPDDTKQMNEVIKTENLRRDDVQANIDFSFNIITSVIGAVVAVLTAVPNASSTNDNGTASEVTVSSDGKKMTVLVLGTVVTLMGAVRQATDKYLDRKIPSLQVPDENPETTTPAIPSHSGQSNPGSSSASNPHAANTEHTSHTVAGEHVLNLSRRAITATSSSRAGAKKRQIKATAT